MEAAVVGRHYEEGTEVALAFVLLKGGLTVEELKDHCKARLARYKVPLQFETVPKIPRTPSGKVLKRDLKQDFQRKYRLNRAEAGWAGDVRRGRRR